MNYKSQDDRNNSKYDEVDKEIKEEELIEYIKFNLSVKVYKVYKFKIDETIDIKNSEVKNYKLTLNDKNINIAIVQSESQPKWLTKDIILNSDWSLIIVYYIKKYNLAFIHASDKSISHQRIIKKFTENYEEIPTADLHKIFKGSTNLKFFNTGLINSYPERGESYRIMTGSDSVRAIDNISSGMLVAGHIFGSVEEDNIEYTLGYSSRSKIWSLSRVTINEFMDKCEKFAEKITATDDVKTHTNYDLIPIPSSFYSYQKGCYFGVFDHECYVNQCTINIGDNTSDYNPDINKYLISDLVLKINDITNNLCQNNKNIKLTLHSSELDDIASSVHGYNLVCNNKGKYGNRHPENIDENRSRHHKNKEKYRSRHHKNKEKYRSRDYITGTDAHVIKDLINHFDDHPITFVHFGGRAYKGNISYVREYEIPTFNKKDIVGIPWENVDIENEAKQPKDGKYSIHTYLKSYLKDKLKNSIIIYDHGPGEIADFVTFQINKYTCKINLYHCKAKGKEKKSNANINSVIEVTQQAVKSVNYLSNPKVFINKFNRRILENSEPKKDKFVNPVNYKKDYSKIINIFENQTKKIEYSIYLVQPGIIAGDKLSDPVSSILSAASHYVKNSGVVNQFKVIGTDMQNAT